MNLLLKLIEGNTYNGHSQLNVEIIDYPALLDIQNGLEQELGNLVAIELFADGSGSLLEKDYWRDGNKLGHKDRLLLSFEECTI